MNNDQLESKLHQDYKELLRNVGYYVERTKADFAVEVFKFLGKGEGQVTKAELARRMGTSPAWITKMLHTNWNMTMETMAKLAFALGAKVELQLTPLKALSEVREKDFQCEVKASAGKIPFPYSLWKVAFDERTHARFERFSRSETPVDTDFGKVSRSQDTPYTKVA